MCGDLHNNLGKISKNTPFKRESSVTLRYLPVSKRNWSIVCPKQLKFYSNTQTFTLIYLIQVAKRVVYKKQLTCVGKLLGRLDGGLVLGEGATHSTGLLVYNARLVDHGQNAGDVLADDSDLGKLGCSSNGDLSHLERAIKDSKQSQSSISQFK